MRVLVLTNGQANQIALVHKIARIAEVQAIVVSANRPAKTPTRSDRLISFLNAVAARSVGKEFVGAWNGMLSMYREQFESFPEGRKVPVPNVNSDATFQTIEEVAPELVIVSGTNIVGRRLIEKAKESAEIINLHTGISPYVKGGPNCTNWCLAKGWFHLIGNTVMSLDAGIDTGDIIATEQTPLTGRENLLELHWKVMEHAHDLYLRVISRAMSGEKLHSVAQDSITKGTLFLNRHWNIFEMYRARSNFSHAFRQYFELADERIRDGERIRLISIDNG